MDFSIVEAILADQGGASVTYSYIGQITHSHGNRDLCALAPPRLADLLARSSRIRDMEDYALWRAKLDDDVIGYLTVYKAPQSKSRLIITPKGVISWSSMEGIPVGIMRLDTSLLCLEVNTYAQSLLGRTRDELLGTKWHELVDPSLLLELEYHAQARGAGRTLSAKCGLLHFSPSTGSERHLAFSLAQDWRQHGVSYMTLMDASDQYLARVRAEQRVRTDALTRLASRAGLFEHLEALSEDAIDECALAFIDLNEFKRINDTFGHAAGDEVLRIAALRIKAATRNRDVVARVGGDEFVVVYHGVRERAELTTMGQTIIDAFKSDVSVDGATLRIRASVGIALASDWSSDDAVGRLSRAEQLMSLADRAMYLAKRRAAGHLEVYERDQGQFVIRPTEPL